MQIAARDREQARRLLKQLGVSSSDAERRLREHRARGAELGPLKSAAARQLQVATEHEIACRRTLQRCSGLLTASHQAVLQSRAYLEQAQTAQELSAEAEAGLGIFEKSHAKVGSGWKQVLAKAQELLDAATEAEAAAAEAGRVPQVLPDGGARSPRSEVHAAEAAACQAADAIRSFSRDQGDSAQAANDQVQLQPEDPVMVAASRAEAAAKLAQEEAQRAQMWKEAATSMNAFHLSNQRAIAAKKDIEQLLAEAREHGEQSSNDMEKSAYGLIRLRELVDQLQESQRGAGLSTEEVCKRARQLLQEASQCSDGGGVGYDGYSGTLAVQQSTTKDIVLWVTGCRGMHADIANAAVCRCFASSRPEQMLFERGLPASLRQDPSSAEVSLASFPSYEMLLFSVWLRGRGQRTDPRLGHGQVQEAFLGMACLHGSTLPSAGTHGTSLPICGGSHPEAFLSLTIEVRERAPNLTMQPVSQSRDLLLQGKKAPQISAEANAVQAWLGAS